MNNQRILFIGLGAYKIKSYTPHQDFDRQSVYAIALHQALRITENKNCDFILIDNTCESTEDIIPDLRNQFDNPRIKDVMLINNNNLGSQSKGAGEYVMCKAVYEKHKDLMASYDWIVYYTLRQIIVAPFLTDAIASSIEKTDIIVANPSYLYSNGAEKTSAPYNYCDMIFAMRPAVFEGYINSMSPEELIRTKKNSESNLFDFVQHGEFQFKELERLGVMRFDYAINKMQIV